MEHRLNTIQFESGSIGHKKKLWVFCGSLYREC